MKQESLEMGCGLVNIGPLIRMAPILIGNGNLGLKMG